MCFKHKLWVKILFKEIDVVLLNRSVFCLLVFETMVIHSCLRKMLLEKEIPCKKV